MKIRTSALLALTCLAGLAFIGGCSSATPAEEQLSEIRSVPSPNLDSPTRTRDEIDNKLTVTNDTNLRSLNRDLGVFFLLDRPSRLSPYPMR